MALERRRSPAAEADLDELWLHVAVDNVDAADRLIRRIEAAESRLSDFPNLGQARPDIDPALRHWPVGDYLILYRVSEGHLDIVRVVHGARDLGGLLDD